MALGRKKAPPTAMRNPHIRRQKQSSFQYSSNRSPADRITREQPKDDESFRMPKLRLAAFKLAHGLSVLGFFGIIVLLSLLFTKPHIKLTGKQQMRTPQAYNAALADIAGSSILSHSKLTVNRAEIANKIEDKFPELQNVTVTTPLFSPSIVVTATTSQPALVLGADSKNYLLDSRGVAMISTDQTTASSKGLVRIEDQTGARITAGKPALTTPQMGFINEITQQSAAKGLSIDQMFLVAGGGELDVRYTGQTYIVKYNLYENARKSFGTYYATQEFLKNTMKLPAEYIDVRVAERAYTK